MRLSKKSIIIGVDVGGTKIQAGAINQEGKIICEPVTIDTGGNDDSETIFARITRSVDMVIRTAGLQSEEIIGIGMGVTGPLDTETGTILECPQLPSMHSFPLRDRILNHFKLPVTMDNDANALLLGESVWGAGKGYRTSLGFTLGTGLGVVPLSLRDAFSQEQMAWLVKYGLLHLKRKLLRMLYPVGE
jgi:glucokinase